MLQPTKFIRLFRNTWKNWQHSSRGIISPDYPDKGGEKSALLFSQKPKEKP